MLLLNALYHNGIIKRSYRAICLAIAGTGLDDSRYLR